MMSPEIYWLALTAALTAVMWVPYILQFIMQVGPIGAMMDGEGEHPHEAGWAVRAKKAHYNAIENLAVFAPLAIIVELMNLGDGMTAMAAMVFFYSRAAHFVIYTLGWPVLRTLAFLVGFGCQAALAARVLGWA